MTSWISDGGILDFDMAPEIAIDPKVVAETLERDFPKLPIGVLAHPRT